MSDSASRSVSGDFQSAETFLAALDVQQTANVITAAADIALVLDANGVIRDLAFGDHERFQEGYRTFVGRPWVETVAIDSRDKIQDLLREASEPPVRWREVNHRSEGVPGLPIRYSTVALGHEGRVLAIGRDMRPVAELQQQLVAAQQSMEREYARLRHAETRYRLLFQIASEAVLIVEASNLKIVEANPAAGSLAESDARRLVGQNLGVLFDDGSWPEVQRLLASVRVAGWSEDVAARLVGEKGPGREVVTSASLFRQQKTSLFLIRLARKEVAAADVRRDRETRLLEIVESLPDAFVVIDSDRRVLTANASFLDLVQLATEHQVRGEALDSWLGRPGVDLNILMANLKEHGSVRNFATIVRGHYGSMEEAEVSGVSAMSEDQHCYGFVIRPVSSRMPLDSIAHHDLPRSVEQLTGLVGRVPLKEIIRETTDVIERLCIEAALEVSGDNRASAAQVLGLSRQSLYAKLRRHGLGDLDTSSGNGTS